MTFDIQRAFEHVQGTLASTRDIVGERVDDARVPTWCRARGWTEFLLNLGDHELERCESDGLALGIDAISGAPPSLLGLARDVREQSVLPVLEASAVRLDGEDSRGVSQRKSQQLANLLAALPRLAACARRIVDVGAGSGHFTRLAARRFDRAALGIEREAARVDAANARARVEPHATAFVPEYTVLDACREPLRLNSDDLAIGLHACGELGDTLVSAVAASGADVALVSCCLQKISAAVRAPLSLHGLPLQRATLGLSNLTSQTQGVESELKHTLSARQARYALRCLLTARGLSIPPGAEMRGINRRRAHGGLAEIASQALAQRGLAPASSAELGEHERAAAQDFAVMRRLSLPRNMLARAIELGVVLDRAMLLREAGYAVRVAVLFDRAVTPRNIALFGSRVSARLPLTVG